MLKAIVRAKEKCWAPNSPVVVSNFLDDEGAQAEL